MTTELDVSDDPFEQRRKELRRYTFARQSSRSGGRVSADSDDWEVVDFELPKSESRVEDSRPWDDVSNAERLVEELAGEARFCHERDRWFLWNGKRWAEDGCGRVIERAKAMLRSFYDAAWRIDDAETQKKVLAGILRTRSRPRIEAMMHLAKSAPAIPVRLEELDANPMLFNCENGTIDFEMGGKLRSARREDLITKIAPVSYDDAAKSVLWERVLATATGGDEVLMQFLQRAAGYSLTGLTTEEKLFFVHGPTATGKSTVLEAFKATFGDYVRSADFEAFLQRNQAGGARNDIARLAGARLVISIEVDEGKHLAEGLVKVLTGGDTVAARFMYREFFEFVPTFKLWLCANDAPMVREDDTALWRRILRIPFEAVIPEAERDPEVKRALREDQKHRAAILAWAVRGCLDWQRRGLAPPPVVTEATMAYKAEMDPLAEFLEEHCILAETVTVSSTDLVKCYHAWAEQSGMKPLGNKHLARKLRARGCEPIKGGKGRRHWRGIGLLQSDKEA